MIASVVEKISNKNKDYYGKPQVTIAFLGDSVTQGCFELIKTSETGFDVVFEPDEAYSAKLKTIINRFYPRAYLNIVNAGLSGDGSHNGLGRLERDVLSCHPDLLVVSYGLNNCGRREEGLEEYKEDIRQIVRKAKATGCEVIFLSVNGMAQYADAVMEQKSQYNIGESVSHTQNEGWCRRYFEEAGKVAVEEGGYFCDCNGKWEAMIKNGADMTKKLSNHINHPTRDTHWLFAYSLFETIFF